MLLAYARATTGDVAGARREMAEVKARFARLAGTATDPNAQASLFKPYADLIAGYEIRTEARIDLLEGHAAEAVKRIEGAQLPVDSVSLDLLKAIRRARSLPDTTVPGQPHLANDRQTQARKDMFDGMISWR